ncbi:MAG: hypothetical protein JNK48_08100 [Bryobacterales bacterium]|nr:hypothetical protein [Bryobacterales bacterium]
MKPTPLRRAAQGVFDTARAFLATKELKPGEAIPDGTPGAARQALRELGIIDGGGVAQWGIALREGDLLAYSAGAPLEEARAIPIPETAESILVLKAGAGQTALAASRRAREVVAVEPSPRLRELLEFHLRLNGVLNVTVRPGVADGARYELIVIPNVEQESLEATLKVAGSGEKPQIRTVEKAMPHLAENGVLIAAAHVCWSAEGKAESQVRRWFSAASHCAVALYETRKFSTVELAVAQLRGQQAAMTLEDCWGRLADADAESASRGVLMVRRAAAPSFQRFRMADPADVEAMERSFAWTGGVDLLSLRPRLGAHWRIRSPWRMREGQFQAGIESIVTERPFVADFPFPLWVKALLLLVDGECTVREMVATLEPAGVSREKVLHGLRLLGSYEVILAG